MRTPTFSLPPCPVCSNRFELFRPSWKYAAMTSAKRGRRCHIWTGCRHAAGPQLVGEIADDGAAFAAKEAWWAEESERLLAAHTASWPDAARDRHRRLLEDLAVIPGLPYQTRMELKAKPEPEKVS